MKPHLCMYNGYWRVEGDKTPAFKRAVRFAWARNADLANARRHRAELKIGGEW